MNSINIMVAGVLTLAIVALGAISWTQQDTIDTLIATQGDTITTLSSNIDSIIALSTGMEGLARISGDFSARLEYLDKWAGEISTWGLLVDQKFEIASEEIQMTAGAVKELTGISLQFDQKHEQALGWIFEHWNDGTKI